MARRRQWGWRNRNRQAQVNQNQGGGYPRIGSSNIHTGGGRRRGREISGQELMDMVNDHQQQLNERQSVGFETEPQPIGLNPPTSRLTDSNLNLLYHM